MQIGAIWLGEGAIATKIPSRTLYCASVRLGTPATTNHDGKRQDHQLEIVA